MIGLHTHTHTHNIVLKINYKRKGRRENMESQDKVKKEKSRKTSVFTVFLWLLLIAVMTIITINGIVTQNAVEDSDVLRIRIKVEGLETEEVKEAYQNLKIQAVKSSTVYTTFNFIEQDNEGYYIYEASKDFISNIKYSYQIRLEKVKIEGYPQEIESDKFKNYYTDYYTAYVNVSANVDYTVKITYAPEAKIKINLKIEGTTDKRIINNIMYHSHFDCIQANNWVSGGGFSYFEDEIGVFFIDNVSPNSDVILDNAYLYDDYYYYAADYEMAREIEVNGEKILFNGILWDERINLGRISSGEVLEINVTAYFMEEDRTNASKSIKWMDVNSGKAQIEIGYTSISYVKRPSNIDLNYGSIIYQDTLSDEFELSAEYQNSDKWSILETTSEEQENGIPKDVLNEFYKVDEETPTGKEYVYVKDTNTIYWLENEIKFKNGSTYINVIYKNYEEINSERDLASSKESNLNYMAYYYEEDDYATWEKYNIASPKLRFSHIEEVILKVNKLIQGEKGTHTHYVGLFEDGTSDKTDQIYEIITQDGEGNVTIEVEDKNKIYYVYDVDENGNKIVDEEVEYSKNKVEFNGYVRESKIGTDSQVVSSVMSGYYNEEEVIDIGEDEEEFYYFEASVEETVGAGEEKYVDNVLSVKDIYQEEVIISSEAIQYKVNYEADEGGALEGEVEELVEKGKTPQNIPTPIPEEGYEFDKWVVIENGEEIEVNPNEYVPTKDVTFIAKFKQIDKVIDVDTSDIQVWVYVGVALVAIAVIVLVVVILRKNKSNK